MYTRTKSLKSYTNDVCQIYEASKFLLVNEYNNSKGKLRLRLIGVRVSSLKDSADVETEAEQAKTSNLKKDQIENFFKSKKKSISPKKETVLTEEFDNSDSDFEFLNLESISSPCPHCGELIEGNHEFFYQHVDNCMSLSNKENLSV